MIYIDIYNFITGETKRFSFEVVADAEDFASSYEISDDEEIDIGNDVFYMEWSDYLCACHGCF